MTETTDQVVERLGRKLCLELAGVTDPIKAAAIVISALREALRIGREQEQWISVDEKLPEDREAVLVAHENLGTGVWVAVMICGEWMQAHDYEKRFRTIRVTHWQPLPEPPSATCQRRSK